MLGDKRGPERKIGTGKGMGIMATHGSIVPENDHSFYSIESNGTSLQLRTAILDLQMGPASLTFVAFAMPNLSTASVTPGRTDQQNGVPGVL